MDVSYAAAMRTAWIDARAGIAGDMLLGALLDAGADLGQVRHDVAAVLPDAVTLTCAPVTRGVMRATKLDVSTQVQDHPHRAWSDIRQMLMRAEVSTRVRDDALAALTVLAVAEGQVHGVAPDDVHFHEVGAWDSIADVVGVCSALADLGLERVLTTPVGLGDGFVRGAHGVVPVPVPAVLRLLEGRDLAALGVPAPVDVPVGELATPTGVALLVALAEPGPTLPAGTAAAVGVGAGTKDDLPWANVVRVVLVDSRRVDADKAGDAEADRALVTGRDESLVVLQANVDDLDPRAWPDVLEQVLETGAVDAWLTPILMKKGRPAHTVSALCPPEVVPAVRARLFRTTSTFGVRDVPVGRHALDRTWRSVPVTVGDVTGDIRIKLAHEFGLIVTATPEFEDASALAARAGCGVADVLTAASAAAHGAGLRPGAQVSGQV